MPIEHEKKYRLNGDSFAAIERRLDDLGAEYRGKFFEENILFENESLRDRGAFLRVRKANGKTILTFKRKISVESGIKSQLEFETEVADLDAVLSIIAELGLTEVLVYEKRRSTWHIDNAEILLDELPFGLYMEIEGDVAAIGFAEARLEADRLEVEEETYPMLTSRHGNKEDGIPRAVFGEGSPVKAG